MAQKKSGGPAGKSTNTDRKNGKAPKKHPKVFDREKRRLVRAK